MDKKRILEVLQGEDNFLITSHLNPDGDAIGSSVALAIILTKLQKKVYLYNESGLPDKFSWLSMPVQFHSNWPDFNPSWAIVLDCGDISRVGEQIQPILKKTKIINIDHHLDNPHFGDLNFIQETASSVGEIIAHFAEELNICLEGDLAQAIYLALVSDTGSFSYSSTTSYAHNITATMIKNGLDVGKINMLLSQIWSVNKIKLLSLVMNSLETFCNDQIALITITQNMLQQTQTGPEDCDGFITYVRNIKGVKVAVSLREEEQNKIKFSLRSYETNVQRIASDLGGGGHKNASGGILDVSLQEAKNLIIEKIKQYLCT
ncbi:MAG: bifunctional oligoribonuclease/PAP phosphatase NrnA [Desulfonauticus sp.]|nr:bifunctional oligoribonuclease/PAP phosphatase NrnA [Desulfonauticus sp.]